jgi:membrane-bound lytic murein transglycosylase D
MKVFKILFTFIFAIQYSGYANNLDSKSEIRINFQDTAKHVNDSADIAIEEVIKSRTLPKAEKVQYVSQVTKYGFKNLFKNLSYSSAMPYSSQVNPHAETYMQDYLHAHSNQLKKLKGTSQLYFNLIDNVFAQYGLPKELKYLAVIESDLKPQALSWVGARGPWQFMSYTAKDYGLLVNGYVDERTDYFKSTNAAARYLLSLYKDLKDWLLVIAAYNGGPGRVYSAIKKSGSRNFWSLQYYLPAESRNHVKKFIATHYIMEGINSNTTDYNYSALANNTDPVTNLNLSEQQTANLEVFTISGKYNSLIIAKNLAIDINEFNRLNPGFDAALASENDYNLKLAPDKMDLFIANKYNILNECVQVLLNDVNEPTKTTYIRNSNTFKRK